MENDPNDPYVTVSMLDQRLEEMSRKIIDDLSEVIRDFAARVDERFSKIEAEIKEINYKLTSHDLVNEHQDEEIAKHKRWHYQIAAKIHLKLK